MYVCVCDVNVHVCVLYQIFDGEVDQCGVFLHEPIVLCESLHVDDEVAGQLGDLVGPL